MKKIICSLTVFCLVFTSCSKDDDTISNGNDNSTSINGGVVQALVLPKKTIKVTGTNPYTSVAEYEGAKIKQTVSGDRKEVYTYTGDLLTKHVFYYKNNFVRSYEYTYENNKLKEFIADYDTNNIITYVYTHNTDQTVSFVKKNKHIPTGVVSNSDTGKYTFLNGNLVRKETYETDGSSSIYSYEYDTKNNVYKNILGFNKLVMDAELVSVNNIIKSTFVVNFSNGTTTNSVFHEQYLYDANNFPTEKNSNYYTVPEKYLFSY